MTGEESLLGSGGPQALPRVVDQEHTGPYVRVIVETHPVLSDDDKEALHVWALDHLPLSKPWEWMDARNAEQTEWEFVFEYDPEDYYDG